MDEKLKTTKDLFENAKKLEAIIRDHIATMIIIAKHIQTYSNKGYESTIITRLENHKTILNQLIESEEFIYPTQTSIQKLTKTLQELCQKCTKTIQCATKVCNESKDFQDALDAMQQIAATKTKAETFMNSITNIPNVAKALSIAPLIYEWGDIDTTSRNTLNACYDTCDYIIENCINNDDKDYAALYRTMWTPTELLKEGDPNAQTNALSQPNATD